jgi:hypothetical protein
MLEKPPIAVAFEFSHASAIIVRALNAQLDSKAVLQHDFQTAILETSYQVIGSIIANLMNYVNRRTAMSSNDYSDALHRLADSLADYFKSSEEAVTLIGQVETNIMNELIVAFPLIDNYEILDFESQGVSVWIKMKERIYG